MCKIHPPHPKIPQIIGPLQHQLRVQSLIYVSPAKISKISSFTRDPGYALSWGKISLHVWTSETRKWVILFQNTVVLFIRTDTL